jgi:outer membrane protein
MAAKSALTGVIEEAKVGTRTTLDVLDAEQELFDAKVQNRIARKENIVAVYRIHELLGLLNQTTFTTSN